jgi:hypothetical protein
MAKKNRRNILAMSPIYVDKWNLLCSLLVRKRIYVHLLCGRCTASSLNSRMYSGPKLYLAYMAGLILCKHVAFANPWRSIWCFTTCVTAVVYKARETIFCTCSFVQQTQTHTHTLYIYINRQLYREVLYHWNYAEYRNAGKSLARPGRKQATATEDFDVLISYLLS